MTGPIVLDTKGPSAVAPAELSLLNVVLVVLSAISGLLFGYDTGVVSGAMLLIRPEFHLEDLWHEIIVSSTVLSALVFSLVGGYTTDRFGRRITILVSAVMFTCGSLLLGLAPNKETMLVGRLVVGVGVGLGSTSTPMYIAESALPRLRGVLVSCYTVGCTCGQFVASVVCALFSGVDNGWRYMLGLAIVPSAILLVGFFFLPESPRWLVGRGRVAEAERVLQRLRGRDSSIGEEVKAIVTACEQQRRETEMFPNVIMQILRTPYTRRALILGCLVCAYQQLTGINTVMYYSASIIEMAGVGSHALVLWVSAGVAGVNFVCTFTGIYLVDRIGRRPLMLGSILGAAVSLAVLGAAFLLMDSDAPLVKEISSGGCGIIQTCKECVDSALSCGYCFSESSSWCSIRDNSTDDALTGPCISPPAGTTWAVAWCPSQYSWIAVLALVIYLFFFAPGMGPLPWVLNSEIHPTWARGVSSCITTSTNWFFNFGISMVFLSLIDALTAAGTFFLFAAVAFSGLVILWFLLLETKGVPLENMVELFERGKLSVPSPSEREWKNSEKSVHL